MHCSGCETDHPMCLFSAVQRQMPSNSCISIGHEGCVRICEHKVVKLPAVLKTAYRQFDEFASKSSKRRDKRRMTCYHPSHIPKHHKSLWSKTKLRFPALNFWMLGESRDVLAIISYSAHIDLTEYRGSPITADALRKHIEQGGCTKHRASRTLYS